MGYSEEYVFKPDLKLRTFVAYIKIVDYKLYKKIVLGPMVHENVLKAVECLKSGGVVMFFSSATYGFAANAWNEAAVKRIYEIKGRDHVKPLSILTNKNKYKFIAQLNGDVQLVVNKLVDTFWPGSLGIICPKQKDVIPDYVNSGFDSINLLCMDLPSEIFAQIADFPIAVTSANVSGSEPIRNAYEAIKYFKNEELIDMFILGPESSVGVNTTLVEVTDVHNISILRQGPVIKEEILSVINSVLNNGIDIDT